MARVQAAVLASMHRSLERQAREVEALQAKLREMASIEFVQQHLRHHGVGPYLLSASDRVLQDIERVQEILGCERHTAIQHILRGTIGPEPDGDASHE